MNIMKQQANILIPETPMKHIEKIGRICYKSEDKICDGTDRKFVKMLYNNNHHAMLEHYRFIMQVNPSIYEVLSQLSIRHFEFSSYNNRLLISFNARALIEFPDISRGMMFGHLGFAQKGIRDELLGHILRQYNCYELFGIDRDDPPIMLSTGVDFIKNSPIEMSAEEWKIHGWMSAHFITDRGITHEIVRHREETSFAQESTRYCNYGKSGNISVIDQGFDIDTDEYCWWYDTCHELEGAYLKLIEFGVKPQFARSILPTCVKTELVMTAPMYEWDHFFNLRMRGTTGAPHPMIKDLSTDLYNKMQEVYNENKSGNY